MTLNKYEGENFSWHHLSESEKTISTGSFRTPKIEGNKKGRGPFQQSHVRYLEIFQSECPLARNREGCPHLYYFMSKFAFIKKNEIKTSIEIYK